ncbi:hypothetical protein [Arthrobacter sp. USHLN218]|uniref:hypothetical protein n=1 Tax=Arthrobacter sp. USHLN218 TaxID=3081232 RepID=UPI003019C925
MHKIQIQADKTSQHTTGVAHHDTISTNKKIGINKLGTLLSSQTTGANKYFEKTRDPFPARIVSLFFAAMFLSYSILFVSVKSAFPAIFRSQKNEPMTNYKAIPVPARGITEPL